MIDPDHVVLGEGVHEQDWLFALGLHVWRARDAVETLDITIICDYLMLLAQEPIFARELLQRIVIVVINLLL